MSLETDVKDVLVAASIGVFEATTGWCIAIGKMPTSPDTVVLVTHSGGQPPDPKWLLDYPNVQIRVRGAKGNWSTTRQKIQTVKDLLLGYPGTTMPGGDRWAAINMLSDIVPLGYDSNDRPEFSVNFSMITHPAAPPVGNRAELAP